jgi:pimeloyl-ACP methyl ester carboxylesterase
MSYLPQVEARSSQAQVRGLRHRILRWGPESAQPIVLLHGFQDCAETWQFLVDALPRDWSFAAPDWRGFGDSEGTGASYWFPDYFADLDQLLDLLCPDAPARVIGHSMGGNVGALYAGIRPARLRWLISLEGFGLPRSTADQAPERYAQWLDELRDGVRPSRYDSVEQLAHVLRRRNARLPEAHALFMARAWSRPAGADAQADARSAAGVDARAAAPAHASGAVELRHDPWHRLVNPMLYRRDEAEACWRRSDVPTLMLLAELSEYRARLLADGVDDYFRKVIRQLTLATLPGVGHMMYHEDPRAVAQAIAHWRAGLEP